MCATATCSRCSKTTWRGCGQHVDAVMAKVPATQRCTCAPAERRSVLARLMGR